MKEIVVDRVIKETWFEASDGTQFRNREECKMYEESAKCVLLTKYKSLVIDTLPEYDLHKTGSEEYMLDIVKINKEEDIDLIMQLYALYNSHSTYRKYDDEHRAMCEKALKEDDYVFIATESCGDDIFCPQYSRNELFNNINNKCNEQSSN